MGSDRPLRSASQGVSDAFEASSGPNAAVTIPSPLNAENASGPLLDGPQ